MSLLFLSTSVGNLTGILYKNFNFLTLFLRYLVSLQKMLISLVLKMIGATDKELKNAKTIEHVRTELGHLQFE